MASLPTHAYAALALGCALAPRRHRKAAVVLGVLSAMLPDIDVWGYWAGIDYRSLLGHRGLSHSLAFALAWSALLVLLARRAWPEPRARGRLFLLLLLCTVSHGLFDAMTYGGGIGVAFFAPFDPGRYYLPWRPVQVAPLGITHFFSARGWDVFRSELLWIWLPVTALALVLWALRHPMERRAP